MYRITSQLSQQYVYTSTRRNIEWGDICVHLTCFLHKNSRITVCILCVDFGYFTRAVILLLSSLNKKCNTVGDTTVMQKIFLQRTRHRTTTAFPTELSADPTKKWAKV